MAQVQPTTSPPTSRYAGILTLLILGWLVIGMTVFIFRHDWENVFLTFTVIALIVVPAYILRQYRVHLPAEFQLIAAAFVFLSLYLGSARDYYYQYWWWDLVLHTASGFILGVAGWIMLFLLNQTDRLPKGIRPSFLAIFGITFSVTLSVLWEIFEFVVDLLWPKANMMSTETGVADTMHDLIGNTIGATVVGFIGWTYFRRGKQSILVDAVRNFIRKNPRLFRRKHSTRG